ncbi:MAG TPA: N-acetyl-D-Glu racemase DgcA [Stellaceae bacterium]|nr:N-acetyl-D-Glu racemase DgcA [Stellaceae bacterium]
MFNEQMVGRRLAVRCDVLPLEKSFIISRGARTEAHVVVVEITEGSHHGRGECVPYARYGETVEGVIAAIEALTPAIADGLNRLGLQDMLPPGAARNALDAALWDFEAKMDCSAAWQIAGLPAPHPLVTAFTLSLGSAEDMGREAAENAERPLLKLKLSGEGDLERVAAVRGNAPNARLIVDANEAWTPRLFAEFSPALADLGVELIEQPLPAGADEALADLPHPVPVCADESCHGLDTLDGLETRYEAINIKLDKTGGLTEALALAEAARERGLKIMVGCMIGSSLAMAPAILVAQGAEWVDLDAPLLLARDRQPGLRYDGSIVYPANVTLWG